MHKQVYEHFRLQEPPFQLSPNSRKFVPTQVHGAALSQLLFGIESHTGLMLLTGEPGTGKSTILHCMLEVLQRGEYSTAYVFHTLLSSTDVLRIILDDFGISCPSNEKRDLLSALWSWLIRRRQVRDCPVVIIDEAQALADRTLDDLRMLLNFEVSGTNPMQLVLAGQPELETKLRRPRLQQLRQRVMCHCRLANLSFDDTVSYIRARLTQAGASDIEIFTPESLKEIHQHANGNPRMIHSICEYALLSAYASGRQSVSGTDIQQAAREFGLDRSVVSPSESAPVVPLSRLFSLPELHGEAEFSQTNLEPGLTKGLAASSAVDASAGSGRSEPLMRKTTARAPVGQIYQDELSLRQAALLVMAQKFATIDRRGKEMFRNFVEAGRSVLWLGREYKFKSIIGSRRTPTFARGGLITKQGTETLHNPRVAERQAHRSATQRVAPNQETGGSSRTIRPAGSNDLNDSGVVRVGHKNANLGALSRYWRSISESFQRDVRQSLVQCGLARGIRESKRDSTKVKQILRKQILRN